MTGLDRSNSADDLVRRITALGLAHGREDAFKLRPGQLLADRVLLGVQRADLPLSAFHFVVDEMGMPRAARDLLSTRFADANAVLFAAEGNGNDVMLKVYLEFWDELRRAVRAGHREPQLLHLGVKWNDSHPGQHEEARYLCYPMLGLRDILRRMQGVHAQTTQTIGLQQTSAIVRRAAMRAPEAAFLYLEASERGNPRSSYDINLYKSGLRVADVGDELRAAARHFGVAAEALEGLLIGLGPLPLGHIAGGRDRHGADFLSVYAEVTPLPGPG